MHKPWNSPFVSKGSRFFQWSQIQFDKVNTLSVLLVVNEPFFFRLSWGSKFPELLANLNWCCGLHTGEPQGPVELGNALECEYIRCTHSIHTIFKTISKYTRGLKEGTLFLISSDSDIGSLHVFIRSYSCSRSLSSSLSPWDLSFHVIRLLR